MGKPLGVCPRLQDDLDPGLLTWDIHRRINTDALPPRRIVVELELRGLPRGAKGMRRWWLVLDRESVELCLQDPGHDVDLLVNADRYALTRVWVGKLAFRDVLRQRSVELQGPPALVKAFPGWLKLGAFAGTTGGGAAQQPSVRNPA